VVVSGSRGHFETEARHRPGIVPVAIVAPPDVLAARLASRGRGDDMTGRATPDWRPGGGIHVIEDDADLAVAITAFSTVLARQGQALAATGAYDA
jgi:ribose 1,5-bisphosphokinase PhnN